MFLWVDMTDPKDVVIEQPRGGVNRCRKMINNLGYVAVLSSLCGTEDLQGKVTYILGFY